MLTLMLSSLPLLLVGALLALAVRSNRAAAAVAVGTQLIATALVLVGIAPLLSEGHPLELMWPWPQPIGEVAFRVDALGAFFLAWSLPMTLLGTLYAVGYLQPYFAKGRRGGPHYALLNLIAVSFVLIYSAQNALVFLLGWEIAAVAAWLLVIWDFPNQKIRFAGFNYLISTHVGLFVLVAAFMLLHGETDSVDFADFGHYLAKATPLRGTIFLLLGASFAIKSAYFPFHTWLPRAHAAAPAHVSALMSGVIHKAGIFAFIRFTLLTGRPDEWMGWTVLGFGSLSALFGVLYTVPQRDLKRLLGYSSTENVGIAAIGFGVGYLGWTWGLPALAIAGFAGGLLHIFNHALFKCLLFYTAGAVYRSTHTVDIEKLGGLAKQMPRTAILFLIAALAGAALPPLNGFVSEFMIYSGLLSGAAPTPAANVALVAAAALLAFVGAIGAFAITRAFGVAFLGAPRDPAVPVAVEPPASMFVPMALLAIGVVAMGLLPEVGVAFIEPTLRLFPLKVDLAAALSPFRAIVWPCRALALVMFIAGIIRWRQGITARRTPTWGCGYTALSARMQYTGAAFSEHFVRIFDAFLPGVPHESMPHDLFPQVKIKVGTHHPDAVEQRIFEVISQGEKFVTRTAAKVPERPAAGFAAGMIALVLIGILVFGMGQQW